MASNDDLSNQIALDTRPLTVRVEEALRKYLENFSPGEKLPSEMELAQMMGVSRATLREALRVFEERGWIVSRHGVGTFATSIKPLVESGLEVLESLDQMAAREGLTCDMDHLTIELQPADATMASNLSIDTGELTVVVTRRRLLEGDVLAYMVDVIPAELIDLEDFEGKFTGSMLDYMEQSHLYTPLRSKIMLQAVPASSKIAAKMQIPEGTSLLLLEEQVFSEGNQVIDYSYNYYLTSRFRFQILRRKG